MSNRIRNIFAAIHHPPTGNRQVLALSRRDAERIPLLPGVAMLSITPPYSTPTSLPSYPHLLRLSFSDVDFMSSTLSSRSKEKLDTAFTREQALEVLSFVATLPEEIHTVLVHCSGGFSRSAGVSLALNELFGYSIETERLKDANQSVKKLLVDVGQRIRNK
ncbi:hypothetical protein [Herbaspirillum huttiense]|uniref:Tyrosine specific protein phosphatases domain-containing protein n=2 Tax=Herbaspirillum huttiense TaxID=863372 RepID=A0AAJ2H8R0_9BURK|nr:hypothetical protein [Herbaspirillum huttiense]MDR9837638.1 hypothetical protein [Herbaspirillum huttiense]